MLKLNRKSKVALLSILSNTALIILKVIAGILSGSVSIVSEAIHSSMDLAASIIAFFSVRIASKPADKNHPYGHGKMENISGVVEGILIFIAAILIIKEAISKISHPGEINEAYIGIFVMVISAVVNYFVSRKLYKVSIEEDSIALEADALHLKTDIYTSLGVAAGLFLIKTTGMLIFDPIVAMVVASLIIKEAWLLTKYAFDPLLDKKLSDEEEEIIGKIVKSYNSRVIDYYELRTRKSGNIKYIDFQIAVDKNMSVIEAHNLSDSIEKDIEKKVKNSNVHIHIEPGE